MSGWELFPFSFLNLRVMAEYLPSIAAGFLLTVQLAALIIASGLALGLLLAVLRSLGSLVLSFAIVLFVDLFRAIPPLVLIVLLYFGLPNLGFTPSGFVCTWVVLALVLAAFAEEIVWAGILSVPKGQWEAARSTGLSFFTTLRCVVLPQALRLAIAPLTNRTIAITKGTALGSVVAVSEILAQASAGVSFSSNPSPLTLGALAYLVLFAPMVLLARRIERRFAWQR